MVHGYRVFLPLKELGINATGSRKVLVVPPANLLSHHRVTKVVKRQAEGVVCTTSKGRDAVT